MWISLIVLLFFSVWAIISYDFSAVVSAFAEADWRLILAAAVLDVFLLYFRVFKWRFFYGAYKKISFYNMSLAAFAAYTCNNVIPGRIGGFVQAWLLGKKESLSKSTALGTVALIRVMDLATLAVIALVVFLGMDPPPDKGAYWELFKKSGSVLSALVLSFAIVLFLFRKNKKFIEAFSRMAERIAPKRYKASTGEIITLFWEGFAVLNQNRYLLIIIFLSFTFWGLTACSILLVLKAFGMENIQFLTPVVILLAQAMGFMIPAPANIGPYHAATVIALSFYGIGGELALSMAIAMHAVMFVTNILPGLIYLWFENIKITTITREARRELGAR